VGAASREFLTSLGCCAVGWWRRWNITKGSLQRPRGENADALVAVTEIDAHGVRIPTQAKRYHVLVFTTVEQRDGGCDAEAVSHKALNVPSKMMVCVGVRKDATMFHEGLNVPSMNCPTRPQSPRNMTSGSRPFAKSQWRDIARRVINSVA
jgi:hypothetical protein